MIISITIIIVIVVIVIVVVAAAVVVVVVVVVLSLSSSWVRALTLSRRPRRHVLLQLIAQPLQPAGSKHLESAPRAPEPYSTSAAASQHQQHTPEQPDFSPSQKDLLPAQPHRSLLRHKTRGDIRFYLL